MAMRAMMYYTALNMWFLLEARPTHTRKHKILISLCSRLAIYLRRHYPLSEGEAMFMVKAAGGGVHDRPPIAV
jgi:hypothetical protein